jgi:hypothetical protein
MGERIDENVVIMAGGIVYLIGSAGLITHWNSYHMINVPAAAISSLGLLVACVGVLLVDNYLFLKAVALIGIALILAFGFAWLVHPL